jgi:hypothetical protein
MIVKSWLLLDKEQTGREMHRMVKRTAKDLEEITFFDNDMILSGSDLSLIKWFNYVKTIPYRKDISPIEVIARPKLATEIKAGLDCKKKAILIAAWCFQNKVPFRFVASSKRADKVCTHVFVQALIKSEWINLDATYEWYKIGQKKKVTHAEILKE